MRKILLLLCLMAGMLISCSDDEGGIFIGFILQDEKGAEKYIFKEKENLIFRLDIINNGEEDAILPGPAELFRGSEIFHVYSSNGEDFGYPYDEAGPYESQHGITWQRYDYSINNASISLRLLLHLTYSTSMTVSTSPLTRKRTSRPAKGMP